MTNKKTFFFFICQTLFLLATHAQQQQTQLEENIFGVQTGFLGIWANNETRLTSNWALRSELGLDSKIWSGIFLRQHRLFTDLSDQP